MLIRDLISDTFEITGDYPTEVFSEDLDYAVALKNHQLAAADWGKLPTDEKALFNGSLPTYLISRDADDPRRHPSHTGAKNLYLLRNEVKAQVESELPFRLLPVEQFNANSSLLQLLENLENPTYVRKLYRLRKSTVGRDSKSGINEEQARTLRNCMRQGRDLFQSGQQGSLMIKPLVWFYSLTAYAYACIILNSPLRHSLETLPGSHGLNYLPEDIKTQFGGSVKGGTFSELFASFPTARIQSARVAFSQSLEDSIRAFQTTRITASCGTLLSILPEMRDFYAILTGRPSRAHPLEVVQVAEGRGIRWEFQIGDGQRRPDMALLDKAFPNYNRTERQGRVIVNVSPSDLHKIKASIYTDTRGRFWYIDNPFFPVLLPELCVHFLLANAFSSIMRYRPGAWGDILLNEVESKLALLVRNYFSAFETKIPILLLRHLSEFSPYIDPEV
jgi:hypothetical protein